MRMMVVSLATIDLIQAFLDKFWTFAAVGLEVECEQDSVDDVSAELSMACAPLEHTTAEAGNL
jgi:hypothetical protein